MSDMNTKDRAQFPVPDENWELAERSKRLRQAVRRAGGNLAVARRAGMHLGTLNKYIAGRDMKASAMIALAQACGVSLDWLATGAAAPESPPPIPKPTPPPLGLFNQVNVPKLAGCLEAAQEAFTKHGQTPDTQRLIQAALLLYDMLGMPDAPPNP